MSHKNTFTKGIRDGVPVAIGYFAVAFSLGITAARLGLTPLQGFLSSFFNHASAGEFAEFTAISSDAGYAETALLILITNARYLLMSCALSQKLSPCAAVYHRVLVGFGITDEMFALSSAVKGDLDPSYSYGIMAITLPCWSVGTAIGIIAGDLLPSLIVSALGVAIYGMFIAIIIPPAKKSRPVMGVVAAGFALSFVFSRVAPLSALPESLKVIILTVVIAGIAALLFPIGDAESEVSEK